MNRPTRSKFVKVKCADCENEQVVFTKAAVEVNCLVCGAAMVKPTGGLAEIKGEVVSDLA